MAVMSDGMVLQTGAPQDVFSRPATAEVARVVGLETVLQGTIVETRQELTTVRVGEVLLTAMASPDIDGDVFVCIRPEDVTLELPGSVETSARNHLTGTVQTITSFGAFAHATIDCGFPLTAAITRAAVNELDLRAGALVKARFKAGSVHLIPRRS